MGPFMFAGGSVMRRLPEAELEIMLEVWKQNGPVCRFDLEKALAEKNWAAPTILTMLSRLEKKGYLLMEKVKKTNYYTALVSEEDYAVLEGKNMMQKFFGNSLKSFVACMTSNESFTKDEIEELRKYLDSMNNE